MPIEYELDRGYRYASYDTPEPAENDDASHWQPTAGLARTQPIRGQPNPVQTLVRILDFHLKPQDSPLSPSRPTPSALSSPRPSPSVVPDFTGPGHLIFIPN